MLSAFGYDGIEVGASSTMRPSTGIRTRRAGRSSASGPDDLSLEIAGIAPGPYGDLFRLPWATGSQEVYDEYIRYFESYLQLAADMEIPGMRVDPGAAGPLPYDADYNEVWDRVVRTFQHHAEKGAEVGCVMLWDLEALQPFNKPSGSSCSRTSAAFKPRATSATSGGSVIGHNHVSRQRRCQTRSTSSDAPEDSSGTSTSPTPT